jgi:hypothetical protein
MIELPPLPDVREAWLPTRVMGDMMRAYGEACARAAIRDVWLAAGGYEHSVPSEWRPALGLVRELQIVAASVPNPLGVLAKHSRGSAK